jgi:ERCC4-type nuclease
LSKQKGVTLLFDNREKDKELIDYLKRFGAHLDIGNFDIGDIGVVGRTSFAVEHKSVNDLAKSLSEGRLFEQIKQLVDASKIEGQEMQPVLLLVGDIWKLWKILNYNEWNIAGLLNTIQFDWKVPILYAHNNRFAAIRMVSLARKYQGPEKDKKEHPMRHAVRKKMSKTEEALYVLQGFPTIKAIRARNILQHYGTLGEALIAMEKGTIHEVSGIGKGIADAVQIVFSYGDDGDGES